MQAHLYTHIQVDRPCLALNSETYITIRQHELRTCNRIAYEFYHKGLFMVKHKSRYNFKSAIYFGLDSKIIKENCHFYFYYDKTDVSPTVLDSENRIILANWTNDKQNLPY